MLKSKPVVIALGATVFFSALGATYFTAKPAKPIPKPSSSIDEIVGNNCSKEQTRRIYDQVAKNYDDQMNFDEWLLGVKRLRKKTIEKYAHGKVLEVAAGTGRNLSNFLEAKNVQSLDCVDLSTSMLEKAYTSYMKESNNKQKGPKVKFMVLDAHALSTRLPANSYDTVMDSYGLCSFENPEQVVREMTKVCAENGTLVFLEHGKSSKWDFLTKWLNDSAHEHAKKWGCWWNRDIEQIIKNCEDILEVKEVRYKHFGTTYVIIAKPKPRAKQEVKMENNNPAKAPLTTAENAKV